MRQILIIIFTLTILNSFSQTLEIITLDESEKFKAAAIFPDIKTLSSENTSVLETAYGFDDDEHLMTLPAILNFDKEQLTFDSSGIELIDEALKWNGTDHKLFNSWFPSILANV